MLAPDIIDGQVKASSDGGASWYPLPNLTTAVTDTDDSLAQRGDASFATTIAWDPTNACHILVGTMQNRIIRSADGGLTWKQVSGSTAATWITSFYFPPSGSDMDVIVRARAVDRVGRSSGRRGGASFHRRPALL
ncbi:MAG: hypothetical protein U0163_20000 [Gemmatimonadaceae bacterium]